jgi:hypothetical protein
VTTDHEGDEVFERLQAEHDALVVDLANALDLDAGLKDALMSTDHTPGEAMVTIPVAMLSRWELVLRSGHSAEASLPPGVACEAVAGGLRAVIANPDAASLRHDHDHSPDPEGAVAREVAPDSDTTQDATTATPIDLGPAVQVGKRWPPARQATDREWPYDSDTARETERCMSVCLVCEDQYGLPHVEPHETLDEQAEWVDEHQQSYGVDHSPWFVSGWTDTRAAAQRARDKRAER